MTLLTYRACSLPNEKVFGAPNSVNFLVLGAGIRSSFRLTELRT